MPALPVSNWVLEYCVKRIVPAGAAGAALGAIGALSTGSASARQLLNAAALGGGMAALWVSVRIIVWSIQLMRKVSQGKIATGGRALFGWETKRAQW